jgi:hypothetical protein
MPPAGVAANEGDVQPAAERPEETDMDRYKAKLARWPAKFQPLKARVDASSTDPLVGSRSRVR